MNKIIFFFIILLLPFSSFCSESEKIYGIMVSGKDEFHFDLALCSIRSFLEQSYPNKELIIINDGSYSFNFLNNILITEIKLDQKYTLGELRNIGLNYLPENAMWVQWDDDDWHHPDLIQEQYNFLTSKGAELCTLTTQVQYAFRTNSAWEYSGGLVGTVMCRKKNDVFYPNLRKAEDTAFVKQYREKYPTVRWENPPYYYLRFIHGFNTWDEGHFRISEHGEDNWNLPSISSQYLSEILQIYFKSLKNRYSAPIK